MASSSSSSPIPTRIWTHDVFLSFRGEDTRNSFVDHLYTALDQRGINVFKDDPALDKGKPISRELLKAIAESKLAVVVFSKKYADSSWCLDELVKIMECRDQMGQIVLPVFYHVDPSDVRGQKNDFDSAFQEHEDKFKGEMEKLKNWRKALAAAAGLSGWHIKETGNGGESATLKAIVAKISNSIQPRDLEKHLFGIESRIDELYPLLDMEATEKVHMVGILGMGGIGKTTLAHALFRRIKHNFEGCSFVEDVRENSSSKKDVCALQQKILSDILYQMHPCGKVSVGYPAVNPEYGANMIRERFCHKKVLLVLDDVDNDKQLEFLAKIHEWFGPGSRIIITTRNEHLLSDADVIYKPAFLSMNEAAELFCWHAFRKSSPPEGYEEISDRAIRYASSLPLALKVLGSFFHGRQLSVWESALHRLGKGSIDKIHETLKLSFDGLDASEKQIFLDIACFYKDQYEEYVTRVLDSLGFYPVIGISVLIEKCLITVSNKRLHMHDLIQEMGWQIVYESFPDSRVWKPEQIHKIIKGKKKLKAIEAMMMMDNARHVDAYILASMHNLRLLNIDGKFTSSQPRFLPDELQWLCWTKYPFLTLPLTDMCKLVGLEIASGGMKQLWKGRKKLLEDEENQRYLDKMLQLSFIKKCAAVNHRLSITIPGGMIPSWFEEEMDGCRIGLKLPQKWHSEIMGFVVCGVFTHRWFEYNYPHIFFRITKDGEAIPKPEVINATETAENMNMWISYIPLHCFQTMYLYIPPEDWSHIEGNLDMTVTLLDGTESVRCGAHVIYKEHVQQIRTCISDYGNSDMEYRYPKTMMPFSSTTSTKCSTKHIFSFSPSSLDGGIRSFYSKAKNFLLSTIRGK